jgi:hypothetical protein
MADRQNVENVHVLIEDDPIVANAQAQDRGPAQLLDVVAQARRVSCVLLDLRLDRGGLITPILVRAASASRL